MEEVKSWVEGAEDPLEGIQGIKPCTSSSGQGDGGEGWGRICHTGSRTHSIKHLVL